MKNELITKTTVNEESENYNLETTTIKKSIYNVIEMCKTNPSKAYREEIVQDWLYNELCDSFWKINPRYTCRIREEYSLFKHKEKNKKYQDPKQYWKENYPKYMKHEKVHFDDFEGKAGKIDLVVLDENRRKILHAIELKEITSYCNSLKHRGYEDIYILSDLLKMHNKMSMGYILIVGWFNSKGRITERGMNNYLNNVKKAYKEAEADCQFTVLDGAQL